MADSPTQDGRIGKLATPLGKDKLCLTRFEGSGGDRGAVRVSDRSRQPRCQTSISRPRLERIAAFTSKRRITWGVISAGF